MMDTKIPKRGEIWMVDLDPTVGREMQKKRPCLIIQNNIGNQYTGTTIIAPLTSTALKGPIFVKVDPTPENGLKNASCVNTAQIRCVDKSRLGKRWGKLNAETMREVNRAIRKSLEV